MAFDDKIDRELLAVACEAVLREQPEDFVSRGAFVDAGKLANASEHDVDDALEVLQHRGLLEGYPGPGRAATSVRATEAGLTAYLASRPNSTYESDLKRVGQEVAQDEDGSLNWDIANATGISQRIVDNILYELRSRGLVEIYGESAAGGLRLYVSGTAELRRWLRTG